MNQQTIETKCVAIVGMGLIGGSLAIRLREKGISSKIIGVDANNEHAAKAIELGLADRMLSLQDAVRLSDVVIFAIPVDSMVHLLPGVLDMTEHQIVVDLGSTKAQLADAVKEHPKRGRYVASHPMWDGVQRSGSRGQRGF